MTPPALQEVEGGVAPGLVESLSPRLGGGNFPKIFFVGGA